MKVSYNWLQSYFEKKLPAPEKLAERITFSFAEIEGVEKKGDDTILDIKVLPDRACYALSHRGVAREISAIAGIPLKEEKVPEVKVGKTRAAKLTIENPDACRRHIGRVIEGITIKESPKWLKERLESVGARAINNVVDATNYITLAMGQPLHAFDADKLATSDKGQGTRVTVRMAQKGEQVTTLDGKAVMLDEADVVIADDEAALDIAGIKGGKKAELDAKTTSILLSAANFDPVRIRKTSQKTGVQTDASKRFENNITPARAEEGMDMVSALIAELAGGTVGEKIDVYPRKAEERRILFDAAHIEKILGIEIGIKKVVELLARLGIKVKREGNALTAIPPLDRLDLTIPEDIAEEVGRLIGYDKIPATLPPRLSLAGLADAIPKQFYWEWKIREFFVSEGFFEVMTSSFSDEGEVAIEKPLAEDKKFARKELRKSFAAALEMNYRNAPLFGADDVKIFEIGKVFKKSGENTALAIGFAGHKKKSDVVSEAVKKLSDYLNANLKGENKNGVFECNIDDLIETFTEPLSWDISVPKEISQKYQPISAFPFIARDVALFVPNGTEPEKVLDCIREEAGELAVRFWKFDEFVKNGKQSFAFRIVFQSFSRTLTDEEANSVMEKIYKVLKERFGAEIR